MGQCNHQFWKDRNPPECMNCGKLEIEIRTEYQKEQVNKFFNLQLENIRLSVHKPYTI